MEGPRDVPRAEVEYDSYEFGHESMWESGLDHEEARRAYEEVTKPT